MYSIKLFGYKASYLFYCFAVYSFLGWLIEVISVSLEDGKYSSRGFLFGPFCAIYGVAFLLLLVLLKPEKRNWISIIIYSALLATILEYVTGYILYEFFDKRWWNYSDIALNLNGYICLRTTVIWGILSVLILKVIHPNVRKLYEKIPVKYGVVIFYVFVSYLIIDIATSVIYTVDPKYLSFNFFLPPK